jgi:hypothetical protein
MDRDDGNGKLIWRGFELPRKLVLVGVVGVHVGPMSPSCGAAETPAARVPVRRVFHFQCT